MSCAMDFAGPRSRKLNGTSAASAEAGDPLIPTVHDSDHDHILPAAADRPSFPLQAPDGLAPGPIRVEGLADCGARVVNSGMCQ